MYRAKRIILPVFLTVLLLVTGLSLYYIYYDQWQEQALGVSSDLVDVVNNEDQDSDQTKDLQTIIHDAEKHVVQIETTGPYGQNIGSGFVYNDKGDVVTNAHVVQNASEVYVKTSDAQNYVGAIIGIGERDDIALIRVPQLANNGGLEINTRLKPNTGDNIIAIGSPHGFQNTVTIGTISGKNRSFTVDGSDYEYNNLYQITADISTGNSGGPLIHRDTGTVIAINSAATSEGDMGFSIPISQVYDRLLMWSDTANNEELNYDGDPNGFLNVTDDKLLTDVEYLIDYFYETLNLRDYFTAYSLLGSEEQVEYSYPEFRELYVVSGEIKRSDTEIEITKDKNASVTVLSDHQILQNEEVQETHHYRTNFTIGYENDQLKILNLQRELLSKTEHSEEDDDQSKDE
ncbi:trypsin-like serine protease [Allobacillus sp. SKP2-8]|uniref:S1C family serine protease n=1 Tax=unclassified Allobacillus TaxID=2628859 RepID=UPI001181CD63|nr:trypsin-like peptidase domain-containing protein [Allobacillus sp. SKP2-8]TSJ69395.1 trypsin-like serine protease [Allobacillus sp. SKP2-8]